MAYQISYDFKDIKKEKIKRMSVLSYGLAVLAFTAALICAQLGGCLLDVLLLGNKEQAQYAAEVITQSIRNGSTVDEAISVFCGELDQ